MKKLQFRRRAQGQARQPVEIFLMRHIFLFFVIAGLMLLVSLLTILFMRASSLVVRNVDIQSTVITTPPAVMNLVQFESVISYHQRKQSGAKEFEQSALDWLFAPVLLQENDENDRT